MNIYQILPSSLILPQESPFFRIPSRNIKFQDLNFLSKYDYSTIFYDVFFSFDRREILCIGPDLQNLYDIILNSNFFILDKLNNNIIQVKKENIIIENLNHIVRINIPNLLYSIDCFNLNLLIKSDIYNFNIPIGSNYSDLLRDKNVLITLNKNNKLNDISNWVIINSKINKINALLFFDNASTDYSYDDLQHNLAANTNLDVLIIFHTPFTYGPIGGRGSKIAKIYNVYIPFDSNYLQFGTFEIAHQRFLSQTNHIFNSDIDEIIVDDNFGYGINYLDNSKKIFNIPSYLINFPELFLSNSYFNPPFIFSREGASKYIISGDCLSKTSQLCVHFINDASNKDIWPNPDESIRYRHFFQIHNGWNYPNRRKCIPYDNKLHILDCALIKCFDLYINDYPIHEVLSYARSIGACPRRENLVHVPNVDSFNCDICPFR